MVSVGATVNREGVNESLCGVMLRTQMYEISPVAWTEIQDGPISCSRNYWELSSTASGEKRQQLEAQHRECNEKRVFVSCFR